MSLFGSLGTDDVHKLRAWLIHHGIYEEWRECRLDKERSSAFTLNCIESGVNSFYWRGEAHNGKDWAKWSALLRQWVNAGCPDPNGETEVDHEHIYDETPLGDESPSETAKPLGGTMARQDESLFVRALDTTQDYFARHKDVLMTIGLVMIIDHYFLKGTLREKVTQTLERVLDGICGLVDRKPSKQVEAE